LCPETIARKLSEMKRSSLLVLLLLLATGAASQAEQCRGDRQSVISSEAKCVDSGGINIDYYGDQGIKVACLSDKRVQSECGADGRLTRLHAFTDWMHKLKEFESGCLVQGGRFAFAEATFNEPADESFCLQSQPIVGNSMFEDALCNYRSLCPAVKVVCQFECGQGSEAFVPGEAMNVSLRMK
jgi:hypothetical protein